MNNMDLKILIINATRYALGRTSYVVEEIAHIIEGYLESFSDDLIIRLIKDIEWQEKNGGLGHQCDCEIWNNLKLKLQEKLKGNW